LENNEKPDYAWLTGSGEPTLYAGFAQLASLIKEKYPDVKIGVYSNGSLLDRKDVRNDFSLSDLFFVNLNSLDSEEYLKINRHHKDVNLKKIVEGIRLFRKQFNGQLGISTYFIKGINDNNSTVNALKSFLVKVKPDSYVISEFRDKDSQSLSEDFKYLVKETFKDVPFEIVNRLD
jgi:wyosine [tRNA(Phe)-imidazoG37] synthetase (radical SAM superfamily)